MASVTVQPLAPVRPRMRRGGPGGSPVARPRRTGFAPTVPERPRGVHACRATLAPIPARNRRSPVSRSWRLTDRGQALVVVVGLVIATAAVAVIGLTAWQVTGDSFWTADTAPGSVAGRR